MASSRWLFHVVSKTGNIKTPLFVGLILDTLGYQQGYVKTRVKRCGLVCLLGFSSTLGVEMSSTSQPAVFGCWVLIIHLSQDEQLLSQDKQT